MPVYELWGRHIWRVISLDVYWSFKQRPIKGLFYFQITVFLLEFAKEALIYMAFSVKIIVERKIKLFYFILIELYGAATM